MNVSKKKTGGLTITLREDATVGDLLDLLVSKESIVSNSGLLRQWLIDPNTGKLAVFGIAINGDLLSIQKNIDRRLKDGDEIIIINPIGGG